MNILYVPSKDPRLTSCGNEQRTNLLWESLKKYGKVYTFLVDYQLTSREEMYNGNNVELSHSIPYTDESDRRRDKYLNLWNKITIAEDPNLYSSLDFRTVLLSSFKLLQDSLEFFKYSIKDSFIIFAVGVSKKLSMSIVKLIR